MITLPLLIADHACAMCPQVLGLLGDVRGASVVELGAGIGRFTGELCRAGARHVLAVDFMAASIAENRRLHARCFPASQLSFMVEDATQLQLPAGSADCIFSNWCVFWRGALQCARATRPSQGRPFRSLHVHRSSTYLTLLRTTQRAS